MTKAHGTYLAQIGDRIGRTVQAISARSRHVSQGRAVPDDGSLPIGTGRRMNATVLFLDICAFSSRASEEIDQQVNILQAMTVMFSEFISIISDHGGVVEKNTGDGLMAYFTNIPGEQQNHASRAVEAALYIFYANQQIISPMFGGVGFAPFEVRMTIDTGDIVFAEVGSPRAFRGIVAIGTAANQAAKALADAVGTSFCWGWQLLIGYVTIGCSSSSFTLVRNNFESMARRSPIRATHIWGDTHRNEAG